ncbi:tetratricopeptide repeat protein [Leptospira sp. GIMC2001]|uniref:tetratricopeptide repeat protein n=1 Tax=Leptospira sp. GIMC2001 TaxID=1513297 RepID=UPI002349DC03|nr:tetratricopeptide repeat protein [Leptospira sp. GIMC2001]WCL48045.1 tetratricopeptide repeat protein [Leptospira sp. GIMC2001]
MFPSKHLQLLIGILFFAVVDFGIQSKETIEEIKAGNQYYEEKNYKRALSHFIVAKNQNPNSTQALIGYGKTSLALGSASDARSAFSRVLEISTNNTEAIAGIGRVLVMEGKNQESRDYLEMALKSKRDDPILTLSLVETLEAMGKPELAVYKLDQIRPKIIWDLPLMKKLASLYINIEDSAKALKIADEIIEKHPDIDFGYTIRGQAYSLDAYKTKTDSDKSIEQFESAIKEFDTALTIRPGDENANFWKAKLLAWKQGESRKEALQIFQKLYSKYPNNMEYAYLVASLISEKNRPNEDEIRLATLAYKSILEFDDLDEIARYSAESFLIRNVPEDATLRRQLGNYRLERFQSEKNALHYETSLFHLYRARELSPRDIKTQNFLVETYKKNNDIPAFINQLVYLSKEDPKDFKIQNKLEYAVNAAKNSLEYKEGYLLPEGSGFKFQDPTSSPKLLLLDPKMDFSFGSKINFPTEITSALLLSLQNKKGIRLANDSENTEVRENIRKSNGKSYNPYNNSYSFEPNDNPYFPDTIRYIAYGIARDDDKSIQIEYKVYDRKTAKETDRILIRGNGRGSLAYVATTFAKKIKELLSVEGNIIKVKREGVIINLGRRNGLNEKSIVDFMRKNRSINEASISVLGETISLVVPKKSGWERDLATGETVKLRK